MPSEVTKVSFGDGQTIDISHFCIGDRNISVGNCCESAGVGVHGIDLHADVATETSGLIGSDGPGIAHWGQSPASRPGPDPKPASPRRWSGRESTRRSCHT